jgi:hypothetical protein
MYVDISVEHIFINFSRDMIEELGHILQFLSVTIEPFFHENISEKYHSLQKIFFSHQPEKVGL